jgi:cysteine synthase
LFERGPQAGRDRHVESILEAIGNTPLVRLGRCAPANGAELWLKLEYRNPTGSMKDRMALAMIEGAERDGLISRGDTIVEYTGGSTGPALALVCRAKGYRALIVIADCFTEERFQLMRALGAELDVVPSVEGRPNVTARDIENMVARAAEIANRPGHYATDQFNNPSSSPTTVTGSGARSGSKPTEGSPPSVTGWVRRAR